MCISLQLATHHSEVMIADMLHLQGMLQLHSHADPILHRDLKSPNLLVDKHWRVKVTDFNLSSMVKSYANARNHSSTAATNPQWLAPEVPLLKLATCTGRVPMQVAEMSNEKRNPALLGITQVQLVVDPSFPFKCYMRCLLEALARTIIYCEIPCLITC